MIKKDFVDSNNKLENDINIFENNIKEYIKKYMLVEYISYYIAKCFESNLIFEESLSAIIEASLDSLSQINVCECNIDDIKTMLIEKYKLKIVSDEPIKINY